MDQSPNIEPLLTNAYEQGIFAIKTKDWSSAVNWLKSIHQVAPDFKEIGIYYPYAAGMLAYEGRQWHKALEHLQTVYDKNPKFQDCAKVLEKVKAGQRAQDLFEEALKSIGGQEHISPEDQEWDQIILKLEEAQELDPEYEDISVELTKTRKYKTAQEQFKGSLLLMTLENRQFKEALEKLENIDESYHNFCPKLDEKLEEARRGAELQRLWNEATEARFDHDWVRAVRFFQELCDEDKDGIYPEARQLLVNAKEYESRSRSKAKPQPSSIQESKTPWWKNVLFWTAVGAIAGVVALIYNILANNGTIEINSTETVGAAITATAQTYATQTAIAVESVVDAANATGTAVAEADSVEANATDTAIAVAMTADATNATATAEAEVAIATSTSIPTPTLTILDADFGLPTATSLIATDTPIVTVTSTAVNTPTPTDTPTVTPTFTPTPLPPDAIVTADGLRVFSGPGTNYTVITTLRKGTTALDVLRTVIGNDEWIKISTNSGTEIIEGYVTTVPEAIQINVQLTDFLSIYEFGPHLLEPRRFETRSVEGIIEFVWEGVSQPLEEHQYYSLILVRDDLSDEEACFHWQTKETMVTLIPEEYGCIPGAYHWGVGIATDLTNGDNLGATWRDDSEKDERNPIGIGIPHPGGEPDSGGDNGGDGGGRTGNLPPPP